MKQKKYLKTLTLAGALSLSGIMLAEGTAATVFAASADTVSSALSASEFSISSANAGSGNTTPPDKPSGDSSNSGNHGNTSPSGGNGNASITYSAVNEYSSNQTLSSQTISSTGIDESAILLTNGILTLNDMTIVRISSSSTGGDNSSFYGVGATILNKGGTAYISNSTITSDAKGAAGLFSYGDGVSYISNSKITTKQSTAGGIHVAGGGKLYAYDCDVTTSGGSSAAIRSDRGGGTMVVDGGSYTANGSGSPAVYCTADITVNQADLTANGSEGICIEGLNSLRLYDTTLTSNMPDDKQNDTSWSVILYQSMSGDFQQGCSSFTMSGGKLISKNGGLFYTTNTESQFVLKDVAITASDDSEYFLMCTGNSNSRGWGKTGSNGADCTFTGIDQEMNGDIIWDSVSQLDLYLTDGSSLTGAVLDDESYTGGKTGYGYANLYISKDSSWIVTGNSTLSNLYNAGTIKDASNKTVTIKDSTGTVVKGTSDYTITVTGTYKTSADLSNAGSIESYSNYKVTMPAAMQERTGSQDSSALTTDTEDTSNTDTGSADQQEASENSDNEKTSGQTTTVTVKKVTLKSVISKKKKTFTVSWKKLSGVTGYQIIYSANKKFTASTTVRKNITSVAKTSAIVSSLTAGKTYYVKVRAYKTVNGKRVYGACSAVKAVTVKK